MRFSPRAATPARRVRSLLFLVIAAAILAGAGACGESSPAAIEKPPFAPEALSPVGPTEWPITFTWTKVPGNWIYRLTVIDRAERVLWEGAQRATDRIKPGDVLRTSLTGDTAFTWHVALVGDDGKELARSKDVSFSVR